MLRPFYYSIYGSGVIVEYLTQISTGVPRHLQLLNVRLIPLYKWSLREVRNQLQVVSNVGNISDENIY